MNAAAANPAKASERCRERLRDHRYEMEHLLARCGFEIEALYGDLLKHEYTATSPDMIWVARRPPV